MRLFVDKPEFLNELRKSRIMMFADDKAEESSRGLLVCGDKETRGHEFHGNGHLRLAKAVTKKPNQFELAPGKFRFFVHDASLGLYPEPSSYWVSKGLFEELNVDLRQEESDVRRFSSWPIDRTFVYVDISEFSTFDSGYEVMLINTLATIVHSQKWWNYSWAYNCFEKFEAELCIGDGFIYVFDAPDVAVYFSGYLANLVDVLGAKAIIPELHYRMGIHSGMTFCFWDPQEKWNYTGSAINGGNRVISAIGKDLDDVVFLSGEVRSRIIAMGVDSQFGVGIVDSLENRGTKKDKHGNRWRVYQLNHSGLVGMNYPTSLQKDGPRDD